MKEYDVLVVGGGAAGLSAALVLLRARRTVALVDAGAPRNPPAAHMHSFCPGISRGDRAPPPTPRGYRTSGAREQGRPRTPLEPGPRRAKWEAAEPIVIGDNVWLGGGVIVCPGVTIGADTVVGAGSVVVRDLPAGVVAVGSPARVVRAL
jgi:hypothetical protein